MNNNNLRYVIITPAKNEAEYIEKTIQSVISQTILPLKWVIVNDGSTDNTEEIIKKYLGLYPWIELISLPASEERHFGRKARAFSLGYEHVRQLDFEIIANLDADISFEKNYFSFLLEKFNQDPQLGIAGTPFRENNWQYDYRFTNIEHVSGACQVFRRQCYEAIGGYVPLEAGGIDLYAVLKARMTGWKTRSFPEKFIIHHRKMGSAKSKTLEIAFKGGYHDYLMGVSLKWQLLRSIYRLKTPPVFLFAFSLASGYVWAMFTRAKRLVPPDMIKFRQREEKERIKALISQLVRNKS